MSNAALFPEAQFLITGVLGPNSNAHGLDALMKLDLAAGVHTNPEANSKGISGQ